MKQHPLVEDLVACGTAMSCPDSLKHDLITRDCFKAAGILKLLTEYVYKRHKSQGCDVCDFEPSTEGSCWACEIYKEMCE